MLERNSLFRQFVKESEIVVGDESYIYGFDYTDRNIYFGGVGYETPSVLDIEGFNVRSIPEFTLKDFVAFVRKLPRYYRASSKESSEESSSSRSSSSRKSRSRSRYSEFVSRKQLKRDVKKAASGCVDDVCVEV
jgi:hypothetical protein